MKYTKRFILENIIILIIIMAIYFIYKYSNTSMDSFIIIIVMGIIVYLKEALKINKIYNTALQDLAGITATHTVFNVKLPGSKNIIDMVTIHPTGIYLINKIKHEGHIRGTIMMDYWEIDDPNGKTYKIKNPITEMKENEAIAKTILNEKIYPIIIFKRKVNCLVLDGWNNDNLALLKEYEQELIFKNKEYTISYIRAEDIFENMKQFQTYARSN